MALEKTINQEIKILEKELDTLQKTYNFVKGIGFENIREKYVLTEEDEDTYDPDGYDEIWEELSDFFKPMGNWYDSLSQRIVSLEKEIDEKKLILNDTNYQRNLTQAWIQHLTDKAFIEQDGKTAICSLDEIAIEIKNYLGRPVKKAHLKGFIQRDGKAFAERSIKNAVTKANTPN